MITAKPSHDARLLAQLNEEVQDLHHRMRPDVFKAWDQESVMAALEKSLHTGGFLAMVAYYEEEAAGYVLYRLAHSEENAFCHPYSYIYLDQILVKQKFQGSGIGQALLGEVKKFAEREGVKLVRLDHWTFNQGAREFFGKNGFRYYNERMELVLP